MTLELPKPVAALLVPIAVLLIALAVLELATAVLFMPLAYLAGKAAAVTRNMVKVEGRQQSVP